MSGYNIADIVSSERFVILSTEQLDNDNIAEVVERLINIDKQEGDIFLVLNCCGGSPSAAIMLSEIMESLKNRIGVLGIGEVSSSAILPFVSADKSLRFLSPNTIIYLHEIQQQIEEWRSAESIMREANNTLWLERLFVKIISEKTGIPKDKIEAWRKHGTYFNARQAVEIGLASEVVK